MTEPRFFSVALGRSELPDMSGETHAGVLLLRRLPLSVAGHRYLTRCACDQEQKRSWSDIQTAERRGKILRCPKCARAHARPAVHGAAPKCFTCRGPAHRGMCPMEARQTKTPTGADCKVCAGLAYRRPLGGCPKCGKPYEAQGRIA